MTRRRRSKISGGAARLRRTRQVRPYETLLLLEDAASTLRDLPRDAAPQLRALVAHADPSHLPRHRGEAGLPLPRVYRLARHLCGGARARCCGKARRRLHAVDEVPLSIGGRARRGARVGRHDSRRLRPVQAFGGCVGCAGNDQRARRRDGARACCCGGRAARLRRVLRVGAAPPPDWGRATAARGTPARGERSDHLRLLRAGRCRPASTASTRCSR